MVNVAIMGHGVVGSGVAEILIFHPERIEKSSKEKINVKYILDLREFNDLSYSDKFTKDFESILTDSEVKIVVEVMGGVNPAYDFVKRCLLAGKSVVTSNKELVATKGAELIKIAADNNVNFLFEASVGGGIPVLRPLSQCLTANEISEISGILNGTTNFILNKMIVDGMDFDAALSLAQKKGYAEKDPTADIEGFDACRKICILAALAFDKHVYPDQVETEGISNITLDDVISAEELGCTIKLIARAKRLSDGKISASVKPTVVSKDRILANVNGVFNAISIIGDETGEVMFYGKGAGKEATASAVVADVIDCIKHLHARKYLFWNDGSADYVNNNSDLPDNYFLKLKSSDFESLCEFISRNFAEVKKAVNNDLNEIALITPKMTKTELNEILSEIKSKTDIKILNTML